jgi:hypothetical protein
MAGVTIDICSSFFVAIYAPLHIVSVNHLDRPFLHTCETVADGTVYTILDVNPVREGNIFWKFIHSVPWNLTICLHIFDYFQRLRSLAHGIRCMTDSAEFNVWNPCSTIPFSIPVAERAV